MAGKSDEIIALLLRVDFCVTKIKVSLLLEPVISTER